VSEFGVYVHVPFCARRCDYCAFATYDDRDDLRGEYARAVVADLARFVDNGLTPATSIFFGGGTPSRLATEDLLAILAAIPRSDDCEVTVECNPEDATLERTDGRPGRGVTRMSFGVQSTQSAVLADLGRRHGIGAHEEVSRAVTEAGFTTWNMDLIIGSRAETLDDVRATLSDIVGLDSPPPHISCYALTAEPATALGRDPSRHPDEDETADAYDLVTAFLAEAGYQWEEISNWAKPGHECRHNHLYWNKGNYLGVGSGLTRTSTGGVVGTFAPPRSTSSSSTPVARRRLVSNCSTSPPNASSAIRSPCAPRRACRPRPSSRSTRSPTWSSSTTAACAWRPRAGSSLIRPLSACAPRTSCDAR
jgi:oxygen-independent coproporphyrinogen-3 oxidase